MRGRGLGRGSKRGRGRGLKTQSLENSPRTLFIKKPVYLASKNGDQSDGSVVSLNKSKPPAGVTPHKAPYIRKRVGRPCKSTAVAKVCENDEFYYGSDVDQLSESGAGDAVSDSELSESNQFRLDGDDDFSDEELSMASSSGPFYDPCSYSRLPTPIPVWLQDREFAPLQLPPSSDDLPLALEHVLPVVTIYEVLRRFWQQFQLTPFLLEDFCAALAAPEQSRLLSEIHCQLVSLLVRDDEKHQVTFGPMEFKDSTNAVLYLCDQLSWPETLRQYLSSWHRAGHDSVLPALRAVSGGPGAEYPFVPFEQRLLVLQVVVDMAVAAPTIRNELQREPGPLVYEDHCRQCQRVGDLLCCDSCPATFHLHCVEPPLTEVPHHDWQCSACRRHQVPGVTDCASDLEKSGVLMRHESLGNDRHGNRYWLLCRRILVEEGESGHLLAYYSTQQQYSQLLSALDSCDLEDALCMSLHELHPDIVRQMALTERLTLKRSASMAPSSVCFLQADSDRRSRGVNVEPVQSTSIVPKSEHADQTSDALSAELGATAKESDAEITDKPSSTVTNTVFIKREESSGSDGNTAVLVKTPVETIKSADTKLSNKREFRMGGRCDSDSDSWRDSSYADYDNMFTSSPQLALTRAQRAQLSKRRHMNNKFSLTDAAEFQWHGVVDGTSEQLMATVRATLLQLSRRVPAVLMHPSWPLLRRAWVTATSSGRRTNDFSSALVLLANLIRRRLYCPLWTESLAHVELWRLNSQEREKRRKEFENRDKRISLAAAVAANASVPVPLDDEELGDAPASSITPMTARTLVKFSKKVTHQVWKQRGEEYRLLGDGGWLWLSCTRRFRPRPATSLLPRPSVEAVTDPLPTDLTCDGAVDVSAALRSPDRRLFSRPLPPSSSLPSSPSPLPADGSVTAWLDRLLVWRVAMERRLKNSQQQQPSQEEEEGCSVSASCKMEPLEGARGRYICYNSGCATRRQPESSSSRPSSPSHSNSPPPQLCFSTECRRTAALLTNGEVSIRREETAVSAGDSRLDEEPLLPCAELPVSLTSPDRVTKPNTVKYPLTSKFVSGGRWSMLVLANWELRQLARRRGQMFVEGFNYLAKNNPVSWVYPSPRPAWYTGWMYRTRRARSLHAVALQLRVLWACVRWDEIAYQPTGESSRPSSALSGSSGGQQQAAPSVLGAQYQLIAGGEFQVTSDTGMVRSLVMKHRDEGRFRHNTMYFRRRVTIMFDPPLMVEKEYISSARSGLRKRRKVIESGNTPSSDVVQEWVSEAQMEIFEIRHYFEKLERLRAERRQQQMKRSLGLEDTTSDRLTGLVSVANSVSKTPGKGTKFIVKPSLPVTMTSVSAAEADSPASGEARLQLRTILPVTSKLASSSPLISTSSNTAGPPRKLITKDGRVISLRPAGGVKLAPSNTSSRGMVASPATPRMILRAGTVRPALSATPASGTTANQKPVAPAAGQIQVVRLPDGSMRVNGLKQGQQILQLPGGQLQLVTAAGTAASPAKIKAEDNADSVPAQVSDESVAAAANVTRVASRPEQQAGAEGQKSAVKMVTQVIDLEGMSRDQLLSWQQKINDGKAKLALVNGKKVILNNVMVRQSSASVSADTPSSSSDPPAVPAPPVPAPVTSVPSCARQREGGRRVTAMANVLQTAAGPRVVIQGVSTQGLSRPQLQQLQLQVKQQLAALSSSCSDPKQLSGVRQLQLVLPEPEETAVEAEAGIQAEPVSEETVTTTTENTEELQEDREIQEGAPVPDGTGEEAGREFTVTPEYIQQSISSALNSANLRPEIVQKLRKLRRKPLTPARASSAAAPCAPLPYQELTAVGNVRRRNRTSQDRSRESERRSLQALQNQLQQRKEQLKREILRKRLAMEQQLQQELSRQQQQLEEEEQRRREQLQLLAASSRARKRRRHSSDSSGHDAPPSSAPPDDTVNKRHKLLSGGRKKQVEDQKQLGGAGVPTANTKKLHCLCKQPFDPTKFYVGCDMCSNWYHGACVGITQRASKKMDSYTCPQCLQAKEQRQLFCLCRTEYDESQFYIGCDRCEDWFHGRCIGVLPLEGDTLDAYECPRCHPDAALNRANMSSLSPADYSQLAKLVKHLQANRNAAPFLKPVDGKQVPDYYRIIKHPMDLGTIARRVQEKHYSRLCDFTSDVILMLDNCRFFNAAGSRLATAGTNLQAVFRAALVKLRQRVSSSSR